LTSALDKLLRQLATSRHNRRKALCFVAEGLRCCREAVAKRPNWLKAMLLSEEAAPEAAAEMTALAAEAGVVPERLPERAFAAYAQTEGPQGILCLLEKPAETTPKTLSPVCTLIMDQVREPGNFGTILRTAWAAGLTQVWYTSASADPWSPKVVRAGMGAQFALELHRFDDLPAATECYRQLGGRRVWCAMMAATTTLFSDDFAPCGAALVVGNEGNGVSVPEVGEAVTIPMPGHAESLNVAQAATLLLFEAIRRSSQKQGVLLS